MAKKAIEFDVVCSSVSVCRSMFTFALQSTHAIVDTTSILASVVTDAPCA